MAAQGASGVGVVQAAGCGPEGVGESFRRLQKTCQTALGILPRLNVSGGTVADLGRNRFLGALESRSRSSLACNVRKSQAGSVELSLLKKNYC